MNISNSQFAKSYFSVSQNEKQNNYVGKLREKTGSDFSNGEKAANKNRNTSQGLKVRNFEDKEGRIHKTFEGTTTSVVETMKKYSVENKKEKVKVKKRLNYSYQKVSSQVIMAKNSLSASKAVLSARRSLSDLKRKLKNVEGSEDEKAAALAHATQMLRIAKKKKKNLEMEELIQVTIEADEKNKKISESVENIQANPFGEQSDKERPKEFNISDLYAGEETEYEERVANPVSDYKSPLGDMSYYSAEMEAEANLSSSESLDNIEDLDDLVEESLENIEQLEDELMDEFSDMSEEILDEMAEALEDLMEVVNPHMDREDFEKLKTKHRLDEQKEIVKADTEYLKEYLKSIQNGSGSAANSSNTSNNAVGSGSVGANHISEGMVGFTGPIAGENMAATIGMVDTSLGYNVCV